jgi:hypothetical protein
MVTVFCRAGPGELYSRLCIGFDSLLGLRDRIPPVMMLQSPRIYSQPMSLAVGGCCTEIADAVDDRFFCLTIFMRKRTNSLNRCEAKLKVDFPGDTRPSWIILSFKIVFLDNRRYCYPMPP